MLPESLPPLLAEEFCIQVHYEFSCDYTRILYIQRVPCGILQSLGAGLLSRMRGIISQFQAVVAVWLFFIFKDLRIPDWKWIKVMAFATLAVYLIHMNSGIRELLFNELLGAGEAATYWWFVLHCILTSMQVYVVCTFFDLIRSWLFKMLRTDNWIPRVVAEAFDNWINLM